MVAAFPLFSRVNQPPAEAWLRCPYQEPVLNTPACRPEAVRCHGRSPALQAGVQTPLHCAVYSFPKILQGPGDAQAAAQGSGLHGASSQKVEIDQAMRCHPCFTQQAHGNAGKAAKATPGRDGTMTEPLDQLLTPAAGSLFPMHLGAGMSVRMRQREGEGRAWGRMVGGLADLSEEFRVVLKADGETGRRLCPTAHGPPRAHLPGSTHFSPMWGRMCLPGLPRQGLATGRAEVWNVPVPTVLLPMQEEVPSGWLPSEDEEP